MKCIAGGQRRFARLHNRSRTDGLSHAPQLDFVYLSTRPEDPRGQQRLWGGEKRGQIAPGLSRKE